MKYREKKTACMVCTCIHATTKNDAKCDQAILDLLSVLCWLLSCYMELIEQHFCLVLLLPSVLFATNKNRIFNKVFQCVNSYMNGYCCCCWLLLVMIVSFAYLAIVIQLYLYTFVSCSVPAIQHLYKV